MRDPQDIRIVICSEFTLKEILDRHLQYLQDFNKRDMCADLEGADLHDLNLEGVNLSFANLRNANLSGTNLNNANLTSADLQGACLQSADLRDACLHYANLHDADLRNAIFYYTNLCKANLEGTDLDGADMYGANLFGTDMYGANGRCVEYKKGKMLSESIIGYKKCKDNIIVTLEIPRGVIVFSISGNKCRTNKAKVIDIEGADRAYSTYQYMSYYVGDEITVYNFNCEYNEECSNGIHFYMTREEAEAHV